MTKITNIRGEKCDIITDITHIKKTEYYEQYIQQFRWNGQIPWKKNLLKLTQEEIGCMLTIFMVVMVLQYIHILNHYVVYLKLI